MLTPIQAGFPERALCSLPVQVAAAGGEERVSPPLGVSDDPNPSLEDRCPGPLGSLRRNTHLAKRLPRPSKRRSRRPSSTSSRRGPFLEGATERCLFCGVYQMGRERRNLVQASSLEQMPERGAAAIGVLLAALSPRRVTPLHLPLFGGPRRCGSGADRGSPACGAWASTTQPGDRVPLAVGERRTANQVLLPPRHVRTLGTSHDAGHLSLMRCSLPASA